MKGIFVSTDNDLKIKDFKEPVLDSISQAIGDDAEQAWPRRLSHPYLMIVNGEGRLNRLPINVAASYLYGTDEHGVPIVGNAVILRESRGDWAGLRKSDVRALLSQLEKVKAQMQVMRQSREAVR